jgi:hypothetical protein
MKRFIFPLIVVCLLASTPENSSLRLVYSLGIQELPSPVTAHFV